jgi:glycosyltransferase involved in cell wall biosynthesis
VARILLVFEPPYGGVAEHVVHLAARLGSYGHEVEVAGPAQAENYERLAESGTPIHRFPLARGFAHPSSDLRALRRLAALLDAKQVELVHCHGAKAGVIGRMAARLRRVPAVYSPHCFRFIGEISPARRLIATALERALAGSTAATICVCADERSQALARRIASPERLHIVYNGSEPCQQVGIDEKLLSLRGDGMLAGVVTVLREQKRVDLFIDAAPRVLARVPEAKLVIVGNGPLRAELEARAAALGLSDERRFAFVGFRRPAARYLRALDVYVLPSAWEALPIGILEALACGVPQVTTDVGGTAEAVTEHTGILVPPRDAESLADAIVELLSDAARRSRLGKASRARHRRHFGLDRMVAETAAVYDTVLRTQGSCGRRRVAAR